MNFKTKSFVALLIISVFLLSSCEVYQTLYGTGPQKPVQKEVNEPTKVVRVEGEKAKDSEYLARTVYAAASPTEHDAFKVGPSPLGPFDKGKSLGYTLGQWLGAGGIGIYSVDGDKAELSLSFKKLVPNGVYTVWCSRMTFPPEPKIVDMPCGKDDGSENSFTADEKGNGDFSLKFKPLEESTKETASIIAIAYHSDGKTYGASPGDFGLNSHIQTFFLLPQQSSNATKFEVPIKFVNHIDAGFPEQDVFVEVEEEETVPTGEMVKEEEKTGEENEAEEKPKTEEKPTDESGVKPEVITNPNEAMTEEKPKEKPVVVVVQETDLVNLVPKAEDPDKNTNLVFTFTSPLNEKGE